MVLAQIFLYACLATVAGIGAASLIKISGFLFWSLAAGAVFLFFLGLWRKNQAIAIAGILLISSLIGFWRFDAVWQAGEKRRAAAITGQEASVTGTVVGDPVFSGSSRQLAILPENNAGKILVIARAYPEYGYGDKIGFRARLETPQNIGDFDYQNYLAKDGIYSMARYPEIELISQNHGNLIFRGLLWVKRKLKDGIGQGLPAPHNSLLIAILFGDQSGLSSCSAKETAADPDCAQLKEKLNIAGLRHLAAVSGAHITIMANIIAPFLVALGFWRQKALWLTLVFIWSFILMIGLPASAVRAGIMGSLIIIAQIIGRPADYLRLVAIAAALMVFQNPLILRFDIGFQLSFLAVLGMAYFAEPIESKSKFVPARPQFLRSAFAVAMAAQIFTLPLLAYDFGYFSPYGLAANIMVAPIVPFITIYGFVFAIAGAFSAALGGVLFFPIWLALSYLLKAAEFFADLPGAKVNLEMNFIGLILSYAVLGIICCRIKNNGKLRFLDSRG